MAYTTLTTEIRPVSVSWGCHHKLQQPVWLTTTEIDSLTVLEATSLKSSHAEAAVVSVCLECLGASWLQNKTQVKPTGNLPRVED